VNIGVQTTHSERVSPIISAMLIAGGIALSVAGARTRTAQEVRSREKPKGRNSRRGRNASRA